MCSQTDTTAACNGGVTYNGSNSANKDGNAIPNRLVYKAKLTTTKVPNGANAIQQAANYLNWHEDILMMSFHQVSDATLKTDGSAWCSAWLNPLSKDSTEVTLTASNGLTG